MKTDIQIAQEAKMEHIKDVAARAGIEEPLYRLYNRFYFPFDFYEMSPNFLSIQKKDKTDHTLPCLPSSSIYGKSPI